MTYTKGHFERGKQATIMTTDLSNKSTWKRARFEMQVAQRPEYYSVPYLDFVYSVNGELPNRQLWARSDVRENVYSCEGDDWCIACGSANYE